jgi:DNA-binding transcriptional MerR regulator
VTARLSIGEFSKMTHLSVKALRHYHDVGLLEPADVDGTTGYRFYARGQVPTAHAIRRFRDLGMPIDEVRAVLEAPDAASRNAAIVSHLRNMQEELARTQVTVASLQALLEGTHASARVELRVLDACPAVAVTDTVGFDEAGDWCDAMFAELHAALDGCGATAAGPDGALYAEPIFHDGIGEATAFVPVRSRVPTSGRLQPIELPRTHAAVLLHVGPFSELDLSYGELGTFVLEHGIGVEGPIREHYLVAMGDPAQHKTEVCWPISAGADRL